VTPVRRLSFAGAGVIAGGAIVAVGTRLAWATVTPKPSPVSVPGIPRVVIAGGKLSLDAPSLGAGYLFGLGILIALVPLGWLVVGPQARVVLGILAVGVAGVIFWQAAATRGELVQRSRAFARREITQRGVSLHIESGPGIPVTAAGAAVAALAAIAGASAGRQIPRLGLPERPDKGAAA